MKWRHFKPVVIVVLIGLLACIAAYAQKAKEEGKQLAPPQAAKETKEAEETERKITEAEVPEAALATLKKLAAGAEIIEFTEEVEYGHTFYEGTWKNPAGANVDVLVTPTGDLVEIEEQISTDKVPAAALKAAQKEAGKDTKLAFEKKTTILYEVKFQKGDMGHELLLSPDGRTIEQEVAKGKPD